MKRLILSNKTADVLAAPPDGDREEGEAQLKRELLKRLGWTLLVICVLLGALLWFESYYEGQPSPAKPSPPENPAVEPVTPAREVEKALKQVEPPPQDQADQGATERERKAEVSTPGETKTESLPPQRLATPHAEQVIRPLAPPAAATHEKKAPASLAGGRALNLQVGVFAEHANAAALVAKLQEAGIPARIESRVLVGPFASPGEAKAAQAKLRELGITSAVPVRR